jgi:hypothetical protein
MSHGVIELLRNSLKATVLLEGMCKPKEEEAIRKEMVGGGVDRVVVGKLSQREELKPIVLLEVAKDPKVLFHHLIGDISGTIGFWVEGSGKVDINLKDFE